jgi:RNA methyltransferase, TrmH family
MISKSQIKQVSALHLKKYREEEKLFIAEGKKIAVELVKQSPALVNHVYATTEFISENTNLLHSSNVSFTEISEVELKKISTQTTPNAVLVVCRYPDHEKIKPELTKQFSLYLDDIRDPGNLGTLLRLADWFGMKEIFCSPNSTELYNPKTVQSSMGAFLRVKVNYIELKDLLREEKFPVYGAVLDGKNIYKEQLRHGLIVIGNEANGITIENLSLITHPITIPSAASNGTESLNAAVASSIICSEFFRQLC